MTSEYFEQAYGADYFRRNPRYKWRAFLRELLRFRGGGTLLEAGCGYGLFLREAAARFDCLGCDASEHAVRQARALLPPRVPLLVAGLDTLALRRRFDVVAAFDVVEHIGALASAFDRVHRLLEPGGLFVFTVPVYDGPLGWLVDRLDRDPTHVHRRSRDFWLQQLAPRFRLLNYTGVWRYFLPGGVYLNLVSRLSRRITTAVLVVAEKASAQEEEAA
ncbi:MAG TPA: class I SAM-dependent methyltransferase [Vicinamibacteria bacterium]|nr:class I SAM-dependent methyltransferase [Vicinamibacteria bacterium]